MRIISSVLIQDMMQKPSVALISPRFSLKILDKGHISTGCFQLCLGMLNMFSYVHFEWW